MAQLAFAGLGAAIGSGFGGIAALGLSGTAIGWSVGGMIGGLFGPTQKVQGPRLADLKLTASTYGAPIPYVIGHPRIGGQIIWGSDRREISTTTSRRAKGGPKVKSTTFTYEIDLLIKLTCNEMAGIRKIFINGELQWTSASDADFGSINASGSLATRVTVYAGAEDQLPDPTYESAVGIGNAPAYRGALTIFFEGLQLGNAGQIPNITFEVLQTSEDAVGSNQIWSTPRTFWGPAVGTGVFNSDSATLIAGAWDGSYGVTDVHVYEVAVDGVLLDSRVIHSPLANVATSGSSDEAVLATYYQGIGFTGYATFANGDRIQVGQKPDRYAKQGDDWISWNDDDNQLRRYDLTPRRPEPDSPLSAILLATVTQASVQSMVIRDDMLYILPSGTGVQTITVRNVSDLSLDSTFSSPSLAAGNYSLLFSDTGQLHLVGQVTLHKWDGVAWELVRSIPSGYGMTPAADARRAGDGAVLSEGILYVQNFPFGTSTNTVNWRASWPSIGLAERPLNDVVAELCERSGIESSLVDAATLAGQVVRAFAITPSPTRTVLETLMQAYHFEAVCADALRFVALGGASAASIDFEDLGTTAPGNFVEPLPLNERNDPEMPAHITIKYMNVINDYQDGAERSSRIATESEAEEFRELSLGLTPSEAKQSADFAANITQMSLTTASFAVQLKHFNLQPTDVVIVQDRDGSTYRVRIMKAGWSKGVYQIEAVFDSASSVVSDGITDEDYEETSVIRVPSTTIYVLGDWPLFRDEDDNIGHYWAATGAGEFWPGAALMKSADDVVYQQVSQIEERGIVGTALTALGNYTGPNIPDEGSSVRVNIGLGTAASITYDQQIEETTGAWMIGAECVIARVATYVSPGIYDLRGLLRGRKGTEWAMGSHVIGEQVAYIQPAGIRRVGMDLSELGEDFFYRGVTFTKPLDSAITREWANTGVSSKPYAPTNLDADRNASIGNTTIFWNRRTRLSQAWWLGNVPLGEETELWHIYRYTDGTYTTLAEPMVTSSTASYTFAVSGTVYVRIAQVSARVGEGYFLQGAV